MIALAAMLLAVTQEVARPARPEPEVPLGTRVRVSVSTLDEPLAGALAATDSGRVALRITSAGTVVSIPRSDVTSFSLSKGMARAKGVRRGAVVGFAIGATIFATELDEYSDNDLAGIGLPFAAIAYCLLVPVPFAVAGALLAGEEWQAMPALPADPSPGAIATRAVVFAPGERVRVTMAGARYDGAVTQNSADTLLLSGAPSLAWRDVQALQVRGGRNRWPGAFVGAGIGLAVSIAAQAGSPIPDPYAATGAFGGMMIGGAIIGSAVIKARRWVPLPPPR